MDAARMAGRLSMDVLMLEYSDRQCRRGRFGNYLSERRFGSEGRCPPALRLRSAPATQSAARTQRSAVCKEGDAQIWGADTRRATAGPMDLRDIGPACRQRCQYNQRHCNGGKFGIYLVIIDAGAEPGSFTGSTVAVFAAAASASRASAGRDFDPVRFMIEARWLSTVRWLMPRSAAIFLLG